MDRCFLNPKALVLEHYSGVFHSVIVHWFNNDYAVKASAISLEACHCETCPDFAPVAQPRRILPLFCF